MRRSLLLLLLLASCGDLPQPFAGRPGATAMRLAAPPPARLVVPTPNAALLPDQDAAALSKYLANALVAQELPAFPGQAQPGDWRLSITAALNGTNVTPRYALLDDHGKDRGSIDGTPIPASAWVSGRPDVLQAEAASAAPRITALMQSIDAAIKRSDPQSLYNRPARIYLAGVQGAPGDGNRSLAMMMRSKLPETGDVLTPTRADADFIVRGIVTVKPVAGGQVQVEIHWIVTDAQGKEAGDVAQGHDLDPLLISRYWGDIAVAVASEAAGGVHEVITNWSGRPKGRKAAS